MMEIIPGSSVAVGMSGGVDSSVAAAMLVEAGCRVTGVMLRLWSDAAKACENSCCTPEAVDQARRVAARFGIPFYVLDARDVFKKEVVDHFIQILSEGKTPNPCLVCNRLVRWGFMLQKAADFGAEYLATGHYARLARDAGGRFHLMKGLDEKKDQSYVISGLSQAQLGRTIFPLGGMRKEYVRLKAAQLGLEVAEKKDSQDLCFIGEEGLEGFLERHRPELLEGGEIVDSAGNHLGRHKGLAQYTIGQRKGLRIPAAEPYYVLEKDFTRNRLVAGFLHELGSDELTAGQANWIAGETPDGPFEAEVKIRYKAEPAAGIVTPQGCDTFKVRFEKPLRDVTPGQRAVIYTGAECLGGGTIL